jgi:hypothetical protein
MIEIISSDAVSPLETASADIAAARSSVCRAEAMVDAGL